MENSLLVGDIGGTSVRLARAVQRSGRVACENVKEYRSQRYDSLEAVLEAYERDTGKLPGRASFGVAGPVAHGRAKITNLTWMIDAKAICTSLGLSQCLLLNDLVAMAWGIDAVGPDKVVTLNEGSAAAGNRALIAAGTGLGEAALIWNETRGIHVPSPSEGGHTDFGPRNELELGLLRYALARHEHVSYERLVSGTFGFRMIIEFLWESGAAPVDQVLQQALAGEAEVGALVAEAASRGCLSAVRAMELFFGMYGAEAGNLALKTLAVNGLWIGGGVAAKNLHWMRHPVFLEAFFAKGRFGEFMRQIPVFVLCDEEISLKGAARAMILSAY